MDACHNSSFDPATRRLWNLWDMLELDAREFIEMIHALLTTERTIAPTVQDGNRQTLSATG
jgi:hypothetical protein